MTVTISCAASYATSGGASGYYQCLGFSFESPAVAGGAIMYISVGFGLVATVLASVASQRLHALATSGVTPAAPTEGTACGGGCYPSIPAINGTGAFALCACKPWG
jgi:hypothetical protein